MRARTRSWVFLATLLLPACHEELGIGSAPAERVKVEAFTFTGVEAVDKSALRNVLATKATPWLPWSKTRYFDRSAFEQDLERIEAYYHDRGYPQAQVAGYDIDLAEDGTSVRLHVSVSEGAAVRISDIELQNFDVLDGATRAELRSALPAAVGEPLDVRQLAESGEIASTFLENAGYPWAQVGVDRVPAASGTRVVFRATPGQKSAFGPIAIVGNERIDDDVIRRQLLYQPGELFRRHAIRDSLRQLYELELFEFANIELVESDKTASEVPSRIIVTEGDQQKLEFSVGYGTEEKGRAEAEWRHVNFLGAARSARVHAKWSWVDRGVEAAFVQPYFFAPKLSLTLQGQAWYADQPAFDALTRGGRATVTHSLGPDSRLTASFFNEFHSSRIANEALLDPTLRDELIALGLDPRTGVQDGVISALAAGAQVFRVDDRLNPSRGYFAAIDLEQAGGWLPGTYNYWSTTGELRGYVTPTERLTLAMRTRYGAIDPFGSADDVPFSKRYFLGGATSLRGWGRYEVAPLSGFGLPLGGHTLFEASAELRTTVWGNVGVVGFVDAGNVWRDAWAARFDDLLFDAGPGLRYTTPVGAIRLDFAYQLNRLEGLRIDGKLQDRPWRIHFSIGHAF